MGKNYLSDLPLKNLEKKLNDNFLRIHRSLLVNVKMIKEINKHYGSKYIVKMDDVDQSRLVSGRNYCKQVKDLLEI
ncbi:LytTR family DNA-binding domain-containing protein [uncultured Sunxiuqinia sp.]|uniref:LytTR family DNA-binding domain-containing protein n=1 Tax=uncultured Sunxiuqinia sp. TaxID=1573825 RepID=UPI002AA7AE34|nr:LytTR family DNA-binding domain-containing protein [uncultured Sunxiuqinia sp.]